MSKEYKAEMVELTEKRIANLLETAPDYVTDFYNQMHNGRREITTQAAYVRDVINFIKYEKDLLYIYEHTELKDMPIDIFACLTLRDMNEYRSFLKSIRRLSNAAICKKFSALSAFYRFLNTAEYTENNPMRDFEFPVINKHRIIKLDADYSSQLLSGILANDKYYLEDSDNGAIIDIPEAVKVRRERVVLRNYAITCLFLGVGLRVSELVGLDLSDINFRNQTIDIIAKGGDERQVFFGDEVAQALDMYINGLTLNDEAMHFQFSEPEVYKWCKNHLQDTELIGKAKAAFPDQPEAFYHEIELATSSMRRQGRKSLMPKKRNNAVFVTLRGTRMSVRSVELMIKEMAKTYIPDFADKDIFSPHKLRATCATRILSQTGDIQLASTQLNHKGIAVTAAFYAELQKEKQRDKIKNLDIHNW